VRRPFSTPLTRRVFVAIALCTPALLSGCGFVGDLLEPKVSHEKLEEALTDWLADNDIEANEVHCPDNQALTKGNRFECTCEVHGNELPVSVEVTDAATGTVEWKPKYMALTRAGVEAKVSKRPRFADHQIEIDCHDPVWISIPDSDWTCDLRDIDEDRSYVATLHFVDGDGNYEIKIVDN